MQSSLHCSTQTNLRTRDAKSFAVKKTVADQVRDFMESRQSPDGRSLSPGDVAALVASQQGDLDKDSRCKRQDIENLLKKDFKSPRYLVALARAMGTTAEALQAGVWMPAEPVDQFARDGVTRKEPQHAEADDSASSLLLRLVGQLGALTPSARKAAASLISDAVIDPGVAPGNATTLNGLMASASEPDAIRPQPAAKTPMERLLAQKQTPSATPKTPTRSRRSTGT